MANTPIPRTATEMAVQPCDKMKEYTLSETELEEIRLKYPKQNEGTWKPPIQIKPGGANEMAKDGPDSGVTKQILLEALAAGKTVRDVETEHGMKQNTMAYWVKKWGLDGISREQAMLANKADGSAPPASSRKGEETEAQKPEQRISELLEENRALKNRLAFSNNRISETEQRERLANTKASEYLQAIQELQERVRELETSAAAVDVMLVPTQRTELQRIDGIIEDLSRARWILERVAE